jgi:hypothetical protein
MIGAACAVLTVPMKEFSPPLLDVAEPGGLLGVPVDLDDRVVNVDHPVLIDARQERHPIAGPHRARKGRWGMRWTRAPSRTTREDVRGDLMRDRANREVANQLRRPDQHSQTRIRVGPIAPGLT